MDFSDEKISTSPLAATAQRPPETSGNKRRASVFREAQPSDEQLEQVSLGEQTGEFGGVDEKKVLRKALTPSSSSCAFTDTES